MFVNLLKPNLPVMTIKYVVFFLVTLSGHALATDGQETIESLKFDSLDLRIIERADSILKDASIWNKQDDRKCDDDISSGKYSLYCALYKGQMDLTGQYVHRRAAMEVVRLILEKYGDDRVKEHRLMDWNNHPDTTFKEVKKLLKEAMEEVRKRLK